jgi:hypothetical protein
MGGVGVKEEEMTKGGAGAVMRKIMEDGKANLRLIGVLLAKFQTKSHPDILKLHHNPWKWSKDNFWISSKIIIITKRKEIYSRIITQDILGVIKITHISILVNPLFLRDGSSKLCPWLSP